MSSRSLRLTLWTLTACYAGFHFVMTHLPPTGVPRVPVDDKVVHFLSYGFLSGCLYLCLWVGGAGRARAACTVVLAAAAFGAVDEALQPFFGRAVEWGDWVADVAGATTAAAGMTLVRWGVHSLRPTRPAVGTG